MAHSVNHVLAQMQRWTAAQTADLSDAVLLARYVQHGDEDAFAALVARYGAMVLRVCRRILGANSDAEDAFQAAFLILARKGPSLRQADALPGWLHSVTRRVALKARTQANRGFSSISPLDGTLTDPHPDPLTQLTARELLVAVDEEVRRLPAPQRSAVVLCCLEGQTREEAARQLGWTPTALKSHLQRGRQRLQKRLESRGISLPAALAIVALARGEVASALLLRSTVTAALHGGIGSAAAALAHSVLKAMFLTKLVGLMSVTLSIALAASTAIALFYRDSALESPEGKAPAPPAAATDTNTDKPHARTDALGDPLPAGAIARLGTVRFRPASWITDLDFTPDGKRLISRGKDAVSVWDVVSGKELWRRALVDSPNLWSRGTTALSADGKRLAVVPPRAAGPIQFWDVDSGKRVGSLDGKFLPPIRFSPDSKLLAAAVSPTEIELWDLAGKKMLRSWNAVNDFQAPLWSLAFFADSRRLLSSDVMGTVYLWDAASGRRLHEIRPLLWNASVLSTGTLSEPALCGDGALLALLEAQRPLPGPLPPVAEPKACISIWDTRTGKLARKLEVPSHAENGYVYPFDSLILAPDGKRLVTTGPDEFLRIWDPATGKELHRLPLEKRSNLLALSKDGKALALYAGCTLHILDAANGKDKHTPFGHLAHVSSAVLSPDGRTAVTGGLDKSLLVWDVATGRVRRRLEGGGQGFHTLQLSSDGKTLFSCGWDKVLQIWDLESGKERRRMKMDLGDGNSASLLLVSGDGKTLIVAAPKDTIRVLDPASGEEKRHFHLDKLWGLAMSPDGRTLAGRSGRDRMLRVWDVATGRKRRDVPLPPIEENASPDYEVAFSPDGRLLAIGTWHLINAEFPKEHCLLLTDLDSGRDVYRFDKLPSGVDRLAFSPDGRMLAWGGFNEPVIRLLETATGRERRRFTGHRQAVSSLHFSADGERLISGSSDTTALVWDLSRRFNPHKPPIALDAAKLASLWNDLATEDAARADQAICTLAASPNSTVPFLRKRLSPASPVDEKRLARLIANLVSDDFATRLKSTEELEKYGEQPLAAYQKALADKPSLELRRRLEELRDKAQRAWWAASGERLRSLRAIEVLELAGVEEARQLLAKIAAGGEGMRLTQEAKIALERSAKSARK